MQQFEYVVKDALGIHMRPAGQFVQLMQQYACGVTLARGGDVCDAKRLLALMKLAVKQGETVRVTTEGEDEAEAARAAEDFLKNNL